MSIALMCCCILDSPCSPTAIFLQLVRCLPFAILFIAILKSTISSGFPIPMTPFSCASVLASAHHCARLSIIFTYLLTYLVPAVLWRCWLGGRKRTRPVKNFSDEVLAYLSVWSEVQMACIWFSWCHCCLIISASESPEWFILLIPAYLGHPGKKAVKQVLLLLCIWRINWLHP